MKVSQGDIEQQISIINKQKDVGKDIIKLNQTIEKYKEAIIATLRSVDQRKGTSVLVKQIERINGGGIIDGAKALFGINSISINYHRTKGKLLKTNYIVRKGPRP